MKTLAMSYSLITYSLRFAKRVDTDPNRSVETRGDRYCQSHHVSHVTACTRGCLTAGWALTAGPDSRS